MGITTHKPHLREHLDVEKGAKRVARFFIGMKRIMEDYLRAMGRTSLGEAGKGNIIPLALKAEAILE